MAAGFDADRFREAVLYVAWLTRDVPDFGRVKLAKALFYADFEAYAESGDAVTGARYEHWPFGPFPPVLYDVEHELEASGDAHLRHGEFRGDANKLVATRKPRTPHLEDWHRQMLELKVRELGEKPSWKVSDESHEHPGWLLTHDREEIPYEAALVPTTPSVQAIEIAGRRFANESRPFSE